MFTGFQSWLETWRQELAVVILCRSEFESILANMSSQTSKWMKPRLLLRSLVSEQSSLPLIMEWLPVTRQIGNFSVLTRVLLGLSSSIRDVQVCFETSKRNRTTLDKSSRICVCAVPCCILHGIVHDWLHMKLQIFFDFAFTCWLFCLEYRHIPLAKLTANAVGCVS